MIHESAYLFFPGWLREQSGIVVHHDGAVGAGLTTAYAFLQKAPTALTWLSQKGSVHTSESPGKNSLKMWVLRFCL